MGTSSPSPVAMHRLRPILGAACAACGAIHLLVASGEGSEWIASGITLASIGAAQILLAGALVSGVRFAWTTTAWLSLAVATLWAMSTSTGIPVGPHPWMPDGVTAPGIAVSALEFALAFVLFCLPGPRRADLPASSGAPLPSADPHRFAAGVDAPQAGPA